MKRPSGEITCRFSISTHCSTADLIPEPSLGGYLRSHQGGFPDSVGKNTPWRTFKSQHERCPQFVSHVFVVFFFLGKKKHGGFKAPADIPRILRVGKKNTLFFVELKVLPPLASPEKHWMSKWWVWNQTLIKQNMDFNVISCGSNTRSNALWSGNIPEKNYQKIALYPDFVPQTKRAVDPRKQSIMCSKTSSEFYEMYTIWATFQTLWTFHDTDWFIGILI